MSAQQELQNKVAVVTGAARNIGRMIATELARGGAAVVVNAVSSGDAAGEVAQAIEHMGGRAIVHLADISQPEGAQTLMAVAGEAFGGIDILVNNAAVRREVPFAELDYARWREVTAVILDGAYLCAHAAYPWLRRSQAGSIINIGGMSAHSGSARRAHVLAAKAGLVGLTRALAHDLSPEGITVNCVVPGLIERGRSHSTQGEPEHRARAGTLVGRLGTPEDVAAMVRYLCGPSARYVTGQTIHVNGGALMP
jgi:3-oxoacyl-[acyl-carrier protein] reductase